MTNPMLQRQPTDDVDMLVDRLLDEPDRIDDIKKQLRKRMTKESVVNLSEAPRAAAAPQDDDDDMWDNVPV